MTFILQENFGGIAPKIDPRKLADQLAQVAENCIFERGNLRPLRGTNNQGVVLSATTDTVYRHNGQWLQYDEALSIAESPIANDTHERLYISGGAYPQVKSGAGTWRLGIPRPAAPTVDAPAVPEDPDNLLDLEDIYYVCTIVDAFGAEGPPSAPSLSTTRERNDEVTVNAPTLPTGNYNFGPGAKFRFYRSNTGTEGTYFQYVTEIDVATASFNDNVKNEELQEVLPSETWVGPPDDNSGLWPDGPLQGIAQGPNGIMSGWAKRTVYFSEPYLPHAWPTEYAITLRDDIMATVWIASGLLVVTKGASVIIGGTYPSAMTVFTPEQTYSCHSAKSLVDMGGWAIFNSPDGLVSVDGNRFTLLTESLVDNNAWADYPSNGVAGNSEGRYVYCWTDGVNDNGIIFDPQGGLNALTTIEFYSSVMFHNPRDNLLYVRDASGNLAQFDRGATNETFVWKSKIHTTSTPVNFAFIEVVANEYPVNIKLWAGERWGNHTKVFEGNITERISVLPDGFEFEQWEIEITDDAEVVFVGLYEDLSEVG